MDVGDRALALLLLPERLEDFVLHAQARDLLRAPGVVALEPGRAGAGVSGGLRGVVLEGAASRQAKRLKLPGTPRVVVLFHPAQYPLAHALLGRWPEAELWYGRLERYEEDPRLSPREQLRLGRLHALAAERATVTFAVSDALAELERAAGREATVLPATADAFPAPDPEAGVVAILLGLGERIDWALVRAVGELMPELVLLIAGRAPDRADEDLAACRALPNLVFLGELGDEAAARLILCADVAAMPLAAGPLNDASLPDAVVKAARLGRRTITPVLAGVLTLERAVVRADGADEWIAALRAQAGARVRPDLELRRWAVDQTAERVNLPLWQRLDRLGVDTGEARLIADA